MEFIEQHIEYIISGVIAIVLGVFAFYHTVKGFGPRIKTVEEKIEENSKRDAALSQSVDLMKNDISYLKKAVRALLKHAGIPDIL